MTSASRFHEDLPGDKELFTRLGPMGNIQKQDIFEAGHQFHPDTAMSQETLAGISSPPTPGLASAPENGPAAANAKAHGAFCKLRHAIRKVVPKDHPKIFRSSPPNSFVVNSAKKLSNVSDSSSNLLPLPPLVMGDESEPSCDSLPLPRTPVLHENSASASNGVIPEIRSVSSIMRYRQTTEHQKKKRISRGPYAKSRLSNDPLIGSLERTLSNVSRSISRSLSKRSTRRYFFGTANSNTVWKITNAEMTEDEDGSLVIT